MAQIFLFGDSITWGAWDREGGWAQRIKHHFDTIAIDSRRASYTKVYPLGISGDTSSFLLERFRAEVVARLDEDDPNITVIFAIGINDSQFLPRENQHRTDLSLFCRHVRELLDQSAELGARTLLVGLTPVDERRVDPTPWDPNKCYRNTFIADYDRALSELAEERGCPFVSVLPLIGPDDLEDGLHPNTNGHRLISKRVLDALTEMQEVT